MQIKMGKKLMTNNQLNYQLNAGPNGKRLLVLLHGYGGDQYSILSLGPSIDPAGHYIILAPRAPIERLEGGASWYDFDEETWTANTPSFNTTLAMLDQLVDTICQRYDLKRADCIFGGFSQGAGMAAWAAFSDQTKQAAGLWCCGTVIDLDDQSLDLTSACGSSALFLAGLSDEHIPIERTRATAARFKEAGVDVTLSEHEGGHGISPPMARDFKKWLEQV